MSLIGKDWCELALSEVAARRQEDHFDAELMRGIVNRATERVRKAKTHSVGDDDFSEWDGVSTTNDGAGYRLPSFPAASRNTSL
jgi:hypothetical protein